MLLAAAIQCTRAVGLRRQLVQVLFTIDLAKHRRIEIPLRALLAATVRCLSKGR
jgi:hypothetical protein